MVSAEECQTWLLYARKRGTLNPLRRLDNNLAQIAAIIANAAGWKKQSGGKFEVTDFMQWGEREPEPELTPEAFFRILQNAAKENR